MIKTLEGIRETVNFDDNSSILLYDNTDYEEYPVHWHTPVELLLPLEGEYRLECNSVSFTLREGDIAIIAPGVLHKLEACRGRRYIFQIDLQNFQSIEEIDSFISFIQPICVVTPEDHPEIHEKIVSLVNDISDEYFANVPFRDVAIYSKFLNIVTLLGRDLTSSNNRFNGIKPNKIQEYTETFMMVCDYINKHCTEDLHLEQVAEIGGFSKYHFSRLFKEFTNVSFYKYLNGRRIAYAERLLLDPSIKITEVALASGFNSISSFMRMFKSFKGCTPTQFKDLHN